MEADTNVRVLCFFAFALVCIIASLLIIIIKFSLRNMLAFRDENKS
jgi:hypothetical protein